MKFIVFLLFVSPFIAQAQLPDPAGESKCYDKAKRINVRVTGIECGKTAGIVNCNEKLTYDENSDLILSEMTVLLFPVDAKLVFQMDCWSVASLLSMEKKMVRTPLIFARVAEE